MIQQHRHPSPERRADDNRIFDFQYVEQLPQVRGIFSRVVVAPVRIVLGLAAATQVRADDAPCLADTVRERRKITAIARQPRHAEHRRSCRWAGIITEIETQTVWRFEIAFLVHPVCSVSRRRSGTLYRLSPRRSQSAPGNHAYRHQSGMTVEQCAARSFGPGSGQAHKKTGDG